MVIIQNTICPHGTIASKVLLSSLPSMPRAWPEGDWRGHHGPATGDAGLHENCRDEQLFARRRFAESSACLGDDDHQEPRSASARSAHAANHAKAQPHAGRRRVLRALRAHPRGDRRNRGIARQHGARSARQAENRHAGLDRPDHRDAEDLRVSGAVSGYRPEGRLRRQAARPDSGRRRLRDSRRHAGGFESRRTQARRAGNREISNSTSPFTTSRAARAAFST